MCAMCFSLQRAQATRVGVAAFHCERRWRVLEREVFRLGTATSVVLVVIVHRVAHELLLVLLPLAEQGA